MDLHQQLTANIDLSELFVTNQPGGQARLWEEFLALPEARRSTYFKSLVRLANKLQTIRSQYGPVIISSGWRSLRVNSAVGGKPNSRHLVGQAADFNIKGLSPQQVQHLLDSTWSGGLGYGKSFTHIDIRPYRARFAY